MSNKYINYSKAPHATELTKTILAEALMSAEDKEYYDILKVYGAIDSLDSFAIKKANDIILLINNVLNED